MTRQERIEKGLAYKLAEFEGHGTYCGDYFFNLAHSILQHLSSQDVVIKVNAPIEIEIQGLMVGQFIQTKLPDNVVAVEPLVVE